MDNVLHTALAEAVNSLARFFGTTTEAIMTQAPEWLAKYGWYYTLNSLSKDIVGYALITTLIILVIELVTMFEAKHPILTGVIIMLVLVVCGVGLKIITCAVAPEIVGAHAIMELLKNMG